MQPLSRAVLQGDENSPPGFGLIHILFCGVLWAQLQVDHDVPQLSIQNSLSNPRLATQWILLNGLPCTGVGGKEPFLTQQLVPFVSADTSAAGEGPVMGRLKANEEISKRLERWFDISHPEFIPVLVRVQWSKLFRSDASREQRIGHCALPDAVSFLPCRLA